jgi:uncharacterized protein YuzE
MTLKLMCCVSFSVNRPSKKAMKKPGVIINYDNAGNIVGIEVLNTSKRIENPRSVEYAVTA